VRRYQLDEPKPRKTPEKPKGGGAVASGFNYRVRWLRAGMRRAKVKHFFTFKPALALYLGLWHPEPWLFWKRPYGADPLTGDEPHCEGDAWCGRCQPPCDLTIRGFVKARRDAYGKLVMIALERQPTGRWEPLGESEVWEWGSSMMSGERSSLGKLSEERWAGLDRMLYPAPWDTRLVWAQLQPPFSRDPDDVPF